MASFRGASSLLVTRPLTERNCGPFCFSGGGGPVLPPFGPGVYCATAKVAGSRIVNINPINRLIALPESFVTPDLRSAATDQRSVVTQSYPVFRLDAEKLLLEVTANAGRYP